MPAAAFCLQPHTGYSGQALLVLQSDKSVKYHISSRVTQPQPGQEALPPWNKARLNHPLAGREQQRFGLGCHVLIGTKNNFLSKVRTVCQNYGSSKDFHIPDPHHGHTKPFSHLRAKKTKFLSHRVLWASAAFPVYHPSSH